MRAYHPDTASLAGPLPPHPSANSYPPLSRQDDSSASPTDSDDSALRHHDDSKLDMDDVLDEESAYLTSQTLNADGTPKRPMNAFMIFARRRRPQISSEHQSLRTGDISKLLSQEWNTMPASDKQFYLDKAKLLKDRFNNKYPDYVYRRRPNNSRRRRKDGGIGSRMGDGHDGTDEWAPDDYSSPHEAPSSFADGKTTHPLRSVPGTTSGYSYPPPSSVTYGHGHVPTSDPRFNSANTTPISTDSSTASAMGAARHAHPHSFYNHTSLSHSPLSPTYRLDETDWSHSSEQRNHSARPTPGWYGNHEREYSSHASKPAYLHSTTSSSWANHSISPPPIITSPTPPARGDMLSTLNSPFYPGQGHENPSWMQSHYSGSDAASSPAHAHSESPLQFTHPPPGLRHVSSYEDREHVRPHSALDREPHSSSSSSSYPPSASHTRPPSSIPPYYDGGSATSSDSYSRPHAAFHT